MALSIVFVHRFCSFTFDICPYAFVIEYPFNLWVFRADHVILHELSETFCSRYGPMHNLVLISDLHCLEHYLYRLLTSLTLAVLDISQSLDPRPILDQCPQPYAP